MSPVIAASPGQPLADASCLPERERAAGGPGLLDTERDFYPAYPWCLNPYPTVAETIRYLSAEIDRLTKMRESWQTGEVMTNVFLLSCALLNTVDDYLRGKTFQLPKKVQALPFARSAKWGLEKLWAVRGYRGRARARTWKERWQAGFDGFLALFIADATPDPTALAGAAKSLAGLLCAPLPADLQAEHINFPSAFRRLDMTHGDVLSLGRHLVTRFPDRQQPILVAGLRTAGSYFVPLLHALLRAEGYQSVAALTVRPEKGLGARERADLARCARSGYLAVVLDDPPSTGGTLARAVDMVRNAGFARGSVAALIPTHPASRGWTKSLALADTVLLSLEPEEWHKQRLLSPKAVESRLTEYFQARGFTSVSVVSSAVAEQRNAELQGLTEDRRRNRLKRIYEVRLQTPSGDLETRYVLAKSVGWGWLGYHAFLAGQRLADFVPPMLGLRDGILYSEWLPQAPAAPEGDAERAQRLHTTASYVAARVRSLNLGKNPLPSLGLYRARDSGFRVLEKVLSKAYGGAVTAGLMRPRVRQRLARQACPVPTLIDGKMQRAEWIAGPRGPLKTDYEHHGMGKSELNVVDPAYDLAEAILHLDLDAEDERRLLRRYTAESGDTGVEARLFLNKLLAGTWTMTAALQALFQQPPLTPRQQDFHQRFVRAWHFLTVQTARYCGRWCQPPSAPCWRSPLVVLDIDGVLDKRVFGFPSTTAAGIQALALLHAHDHAIALDTARSALEVQAYCQAYGCVGGVAEYGSYLWDAVSRRGRVLVSAESQRQLEQARQALAQLPGVFLDERYRHSVRAFTYEERAAALSRLSLPGPLRALLALGAEEPAPVPLPTLLVRAVLASLGLDRLRLLQTTVDTTLVAREVDKGSGLLALLSWVGQEGLATVAVGDSEPDLAMFRVARRSFAPSHIGCARQARALGCHIARQPCQRGLLRIVRALVHPDDSRCPRCAAGDIASSPDQELFLDLFKAADRKRSVGFLRALLDPRAYRFFVR